MYRNVRLVRSGERYVLGLAPSQFELVRRVLVDLYGGGHPPQVIAVVTGVASAELLQLRDRQVDFRSRSNIDLTLTESDLRAICGSLAFAFLNRFSEEAFHNRYGFYSENVQTVWQAICAALAD